MHSVKEIHEYEKSSSSNDETIDQCLEIIEPLDKIGSIANIKTLEDIG